MSERYIQLPEGTDLDTLRRMFGALANIDADGHMTWPGATDEQIATACEECAKFFDAHPTPPIPAPTATLVNLQMSEIVVKPKPEQK